MKKRILGLDLGTNSIGWVLIEINHKTKTVRIIGLGSRIIPMNADEIKDFESQGKIKSTAAQRTEHKSSRKLNERFKLRRDRLHLVLNLLNALPEHYKLEIYLPNNNKTKGKEADGKFRHNKEPKLAYLPKLNGQKKAEFLFKESYQEMMNELGIENKKGKRIPYDWTLYYLRDKALKNKEQLEKENKKPLTLEELAWVLLSYNQKRGYEKTEVIDQSTKDNEFIEELDLKVISVNESQDNKGKFFNIQLGGNDNFTYKEYTDKQMTFIGDLKKVVKTSKVDEQGDIDKRKTEYKVIDIYPLKIAKVEYEKENGKHKYTLLFSNGWKFERKPLKNYTSKYKNVTNNEFDFIIETKYNSKGELIQTQGKDRIFREPDYGEDSNDWTLLKMKTEKEALEFNANKGFLTNNGNTKKYISPKIYDILKKDAKDAKTGKRTKIIGGMVQVLDRDFYREELNDIIKNQQAFHSQLNDKELFEKCVRLLYPQNEEHRKNLLKNKNAIQHLLVQDILLYQRPLKSKKSEIANCKYEIKYWREEVNKETRKAKQIPVYQKVVSASHPYYQVFRIWDKLHNLRIIQLEKEVNGKKETNIDVTKEYIKTPDDWQKLFEELNNRKSLTQSKFLDFCKKEYQLPYNKKEPNFVWNFPEDEELKGNETRVSFAIRFKRRGFTEYNNFLTIEKEYDLWHYLYSVNYQQRNANNKKSLHTFFNRFFEGTNINEEIKQKVIDDFANYPKFPSKYGAYSEKALKKLLPLINLGTVKTYPWENEKWYKKWQDKLEERKGEIVKRLKTIDFESDKIDYSNVVKTDVNIANKEIPFSKGLFKTFKGVKSIEEFKNLNLTKASYLVYGRHSELAQPIYWNTPRKIREELHQELKHNSLNNPIAEKVLLEMMQVVADIWEEYGEKDDNDNYKKLFDEIHVEVGRELNKSAKEKEKVSKRQKENRLKNKRLRQILEDFLSKSEYSANPKNSDHFERLKIAEKGATERMYKEKDFFENEKLKNITKKDIETILNQSKISQSDFDKYKLWIEQGYRSPYSGKMINLTDLFNGTKYNIDHIFPQAKITNNSLSNKVVCEVKLNQLKKDRTAREFIQLQKGQPHEGIPVLSEEEYIALVKKQFSGTKQMILLAKEIPAGFTNSQLNNTRYISRKAMELLSHVVREKGEVEFRSKNVLSVTGAVTNELKKAWRLNEVWRELVQPRFERMNELTKSNLFGQWEKSKLGHPYFNCNIDKSISEKNPSYNIKRIDHRHHALDALIVALCTQEHVNYINNINAEAKSENYGKQKRIEKYRETLKKKIKYSETNKEKPKDKRWFYMLPGEKRANNAIDSKRDSVIKMNYLYKDQDFGKEYNYKKMILSALQDTITTFKQNLRVINKRVNYYKNSPNNITWQEPRTFKDIPKSKNKYNWGIRRSLGKATYYGRVNLKIKEEKKLHSVVKLIFEDINVIVNKEFKKEIKKVLLENNDIKRFTKAIENKYPKDTIIEVYYFTDHIKDNKKIAIREQLSEKFDRKKIKTITDTGIQKILNNHLKQFDTVKLPFDDAIKYYDALMEKDEFEAIVKDVEKDISSVEELIEIIKNNNYKFDNTNYKELNVFVEKVRNTDFRNGQNYEISEHPEIAFTPEAIKQMNQPENLLRLNEGKKHTPIKKVRVSRGFGNQRPVGNNKNSVKSKQFIVNDKGFNIFIAIYEIENKGNISRKNPIRIFKEINLIDLIEYQKKTRSFNLPIEYEIYNKQGEKYNFLFTLTQNDVIKFSDGEKELIYAFNRFTGNELYFRPINHAAEIYKGEVDLKANGKGSQVNETTSFDGKQIKNICWKLEVDRLGKVEDYKR